MRRIGGGHRRFSGGQGKENFEKTKREIKNTHIIRIVIEQEVESTSKRCVDALAAQYLDGIENFSPHCGQGDTKYGEYKTSEAAIVSAKRKK